MIREPQTIRRFLAFAATPSGTRWLAAVAVVTSMLFAEAVGAIINRDGIVYLRAATAFLDGGLSSAMAQYNWPAYSIFIALLARGLGCSPEIAGHLLNGLSLLILVDAFIRCAHLLDREARPWIPALVVLSLPVLGHRLDIYRDWGYLAFAMLSCVPLLRYWLAARGRLRDVLAWLLALTMALLFRIEAAALLVLTPLLFALQPRPWAERLRNALLFSIAWLLPVLLALLVGGLRGQLDFGKLAEVIAYADPDSSLVRFSELSQRFAEAVLNKYSDDYAGYMLAAGIVAMVVRMIFTNLGALLNVLLIVGGWRGWGRLGSGYRLLFGLLGLQVLVVTGFLANRVITVNRYALFGSLLLMLLTCVSIERLLDAGRRSRKGDARARSVILLALAIAVTVNITARPDAKEYLRDAGEWMHEQLPVQAELVANEDRLLYYAGRGPGPKLDNYEKIVAELQRVRPPYYLALRFDDEHVERMRALVGVQPLKVFHSTRADERAEVYFVPAERTQ